MTDEHIDLDALIREAYAAGINGRNWAIYYGIPVVLPEDAEWRELSEDRRLIMTAAVMKMRMWRESSFWLGNVVFGAVVIVASVLARRGAAHFGRVCVGGGLLALSAVMGLSVLVSSWYSNELARQLPQILGQLSWPVLGVVGIASGFIYSLWRGITAVALWIPASYLVNLAGRLMVWEVKGAIYRRLR